MKRKTTPTSPKSPDRQEADQKRAERQANPHLVFAATVISLLFGALAGIFGFAIASSIPADWPLVGQLNVVALFEEQEQQVLLSTRRDEASVVQRSPQIVQQVASVYTGVPFQDESAELLGYAVSVTTDGLLVLPSDVVLDQEELPIVMLENGEVYPILQTTEYGDLGLLFARIDSNELSPAVFGSNSTFSPGETVWAVEQAVGSYSVYERKVAGSATATATRSSSLVEQRYELDADPSSHSTGTPLFNSDAVVVGMVMNDGTVFPGSALAGAVKTVQSSIAITDPALELEYVNLASVPAVVKEAEELPEDGFWIRTVVLDTDAVGFEAGDVITHVNNEFIQAEDDLSTMLYSQERGSTFYVTVYTAGDEQQTQFVF